MSSERFQGLAVIERKLTELIRKIEKNDRAGVREILSDLTAYDASSHIRAAE